MDITHKSSVTPDQIDHLGHMNVRFYGVNAHAGTWSFLERLGLSYGSMTVADVYTRHHREQLVDAPLEVRTGVLQANTQGIQLYHELGNAENGSLAASFVHQLRAKAPLGSAQLELAGKASVSAPPHGQPRSLSLDTDPVASAPTIEQLNDLDLAMRHPRSITAEECDANGVHDAATASHMIWAGESFDGEQGPPPLRDGPNGERMGWAVMETRLAISRLPSVGTRIQSFGAIVGTGEKVGHRCMWAFDMENGELLVASQIINLAFDTISRRAMIVPPEVRTAEAKLLQPHLAPR